MFKRVALFLALNMAILVTITIVARLFGLDFNTYGPELKLGNMLAFAALYGFVGAFISLLLSKPMAKWSTKAKPVDESTPVGRWLLSVVSHQAERSGIRMPEVCIYDSPEPNAFATGAFKNSALVAVSTGLLARLDKEEVEAVLGHEIGHVANGDMVTMTLLQGVLNTFVIFVARLIGWVVDRIVLKNESDSPGIAQIGVTILMEIVLGLVATLIMAWFSRRREFRADEAGAFLTRPKAMANALRRLESQEPSALPANLAAMGIRAAPNSWLALFSTHPPIATRIAAIEAAAATR